MPQCRKCEKIFKKSYVGSCERLCEKCWKNSYSKRKFAKNVKEESK